MSMLSAGFEPAIQTIKRSKTYALDTREIQVQLQKRLLKLYANRKGVDAKYTTLSSHSVNPEKFMSQFALRSACVRLVKHSAVSFKSFVVYMTFSWLTRGKTQQTVMVLRNTQ
jgi:hypothetical protein